MSVCKHKNVPLSSTIPVLEEKELLLKVLQISNKFTDVVVLRIYSLHRHKPVLNGYEETNNKR